MRRKPDFQVQLVSALSHPGRGPYPPVHGVQVKHLGLLHDRVTDSVTQPEWLAWS
ncbi:hypothetical protein GCM10023094_55520 [Rhodococcus olei]|uniref:Uncharacterized protein n=1 Tax=Rhodococcus olei TaxID=2161675 RepID=A0ABP8PQL2_9NOCA